MAALSARLSVVRPDNTEIQNTVWERAAARIAALYTACVTRLAARLGDEMSGV